MSEGYYPKYYLKKRQRDNLYRRIWQWIGGLALVVTAVMVGLIAFKQFGPQSRSASKASERAEMREELETNERLAAAAQSIPVKRADSPAAVKPRFDGKLSELEYSASIPPIHVSIDGSIKPDDDPHAVIDDDDAGEVGEAVNESAAINETPKSPEGGAPAPPGANVETVRNPDPPAADPPVKKPVPEEKPAETKPAPKPAAPEPEPEPPAAKVTKYAVYAGYFKDRDSAVSSKKDLNVLGFPGTIKENGGEYMIQVASVETLEEADVLKDKLVQGGFGKSFVVRQP